MTDLRSPLIPVARSKLSRSRTPCRRNTIPRHSIDRTMINCLDINFNRVSPQSFGRDPYIPPCTRASIAGEFCFIKNPMGPSAAIYSAPPAGASDEIASEEDAVGLFAGSSSSSEVTELTLEGFSSVQPAAGSSTPTYPGSTAVSSPVRASVEAHDETGARTGTVIRLSVGTRRIAMQTPRQSLEMGIVAWTHR